MFIFIVRFWCSVMVVETWQCSGFTDIVFTSDDLDSYILEFPSAADKVTSSID